MPSRQSKQVNHEEEDSLQRKMERIASTATPESILKQGNLWKSRDFIQWEWTLSTDIIKKKKLEKYEAPQRY
jgi:hypothetical protein